MQAAVEQILQKLQKSGYATKAQVSNQAFLIARCDVSSPLTYAITAGCLGIWQCRCALPLGEGHRSPCSTSCWRPGLEQFSGDRLPPLLQYSCALATCASVSHHPSGHAGSVETSCRHRRCGCRARCCVVSSCREQQGSKTVQSSLCCVKVASACGLRRMASGVALFQASFPTCWMQAAMCTLWMNYSSRIHGYHRHLSRTE